MKDRIMKTLTELRDHFEDIIGKDIIDYIESEILEALEDN